MMAHIRARSGGVVRERGVQSRRVRAGGVEPGRHNAPPPPARGNVWQVIAIVALIAATAGWTTVAVLTLGGRPVAEANPSGSFEPDATDEATPPPVADTHDAPELEAVLPLELNGTELQVQSWMGDAYLTDDSFSTSLTAFLTKAGKTPENLRFAQAYDPTQALDGSVGVYRVDGIKATAIRDALIAAWKVDYPEMIVSTVTLDGKEVTKGDFGEETIASYFYVRDDLVFDIETTDQAIATAALASLPKPGASPSRAPSAAPSAAPVASPTPS
jgi:hypothetical protein